MSKKNVLVGVMTLCLWACGGSATSSGDTTGSGGASSSTTGATTSSGTGGSGGSGGGGGGCVDPSDPGPFDLGTGELCFESLTAGQEINVIAGPQGGYHLWTAILCPDCPQDTLIAYATRDIVTHEALSYEDATVVKPQGPAGRVVGLPAPLPGTPWDETTKLPKGTHVLLWAAHRDAQGNTIHEAEVEVVLGDEVYWDPCETDPDQCFDG